MVIFDALNKAVLFFGEMAEWFKAAVLKTVVLSRAPGVRIPLSPPKKFSCLKSSSAVKYIWPDCYLFTWSAKRE